MTGLPEGWDQSAERIAWHCARTRRGDTPGLSLDDRHDAALDGIIELVAEHGWPADEGNLFRAGFAAIKREAYEHFKHVRRWTFWYEPPGTLDPIAEKITDKLAVWQVAWELTETQWAAVWALAEVGKRGGTWRDAADLLGKSPASYRTALYEARKRCRGLWLAPDETPRGLWARDTTRSSATITTMAYRLRDKARDQARKAAA